MRKLLLLTIILLLFQFAQVSAQNAIMERVQQNISKIETTTTYQPLVEVKEKADLPLMDKSVLSEKQFFQINTQTAKNIKDSKGEYLQMTIPVEGKDTELQLVKANIFTNDFRAVAASNPDVELNIDRGLHYWGIVKGAEKSLVAISFFDNEMTGVISLKDRQYSLGKYENSDYHILYKESNLNYTPGFSCETPPLADDENEEIIVNNGSAAKAAADNCVEIHIEADYNLFQDMGGINNTSDYVNGVFAQVATLYANDDMTIQLSYLQIWDKPSPYNGNDLVKISNQDYGNTHGTLVHLLHRSGGGGIAYVNRICSSNNNLNVGASGIHGTYNNVPTYSWDVYVIAHELGHNIASRHTHQCEWNGNNTAIDGCGTIAGDEDGCDGPIPSDGGTIMSYCHQLSHVGINFTKGFDNQPAELMRDRISSASCVESCDDAGGGQSGIVVMRKRNAMSYAMDGSGNSANGQNVKLWDYDPNNTNQQWIEIDRGGGYYSYQKVSGNGNYCLDGGNGGSNGQNLYLWTCIAGEKNQHWQKISVGGGAYRLKKRNASYSIDGNNGGSRGQNVYIWSSSNSERNQHWVFEAVGQAGGNGGGNDGGNDGGGGTQNLALSGSASQSSTSHNGAASRAIDNNTSGNWNNGSVTHTSHQNQPWWQVRLQQNSDIEQIKIFNRTDCCASRLSNFTVSVLNNNGSVVWSKSYSNPPTPSLTINLNKEGRTVRVSLNNGSQPLSLAEVQVFGTVNGTQNDNDDNGSGDSDIVVMRKRNAMSYAMDGNPNGANNQNVMLWDYNRNNINQQWIEIDRGGGYYSYQKNGTNYCMDGGNGGGNNQNLKLWSCQNGNWNQHWKKISSGDGSYRLQKRNASDYSIDGNPGGSRNQNVMLWPNGSTNRNQHWVFEVVGQARVEQEQDVNLYIYPNPFSSQLTVELPREVESTSMSVQLIDITGKVVYEKNQLVTGQILQINGELPNGFYFLKWTDEQNQMFATRKVIKQ